MIPTSVSHEKNTSQYFKQCVEGYGQVVLELFSWRPDDLFCFIALFGWVQSVKTQLFQQSSSQVTMFAWLATFQIFIYLFELCWERAANLFY